MRSPRPLVEDTPRLTIGAVKAAGVLDGEASRRIELKDSDIVVTVRRYGADVRVNVNGMAQTIGICTKTLKYGEAPRFTCPVSGRTTTALFLLDGRLLSRQAHGLSYRSQRLSKQERLEEAIADKLQLLTGTPPSRPVRGAKRAKVLAWVDARSEHLEESQRAVLDKLRQASSPKRRRRVPTPKSPLSTDQALLLGRSRPHFMKSREVIDRLNEDETPEPLATAGLPRLEGRRTAKTDTPELDLRRLRPTRGRAHGHKLVWPKPADLALLALVGSDARGEHLLLEAWSADGMILYGRQRLTIVGGARQGDRFMLCPVTGERRNKLYWKAGRFASPVAQRLL